MSIIYAVRKVSYSALQQSSHRIIRLGRKFGSHLESPMLHRSGNHQWALNPPILMSKTRGHWWSQYGGQVTQHITQHLYLFPRDTSICQRRHSFKYQHMFHQYQTSMGSYPPKTHFETKRPLMVSYGGQVRTTQINRQQWTVLSHYPLPDNNDPVNLRLSPRYRPHLSSPVERSNWLTPEKTMKRRTVFPQTRSYATNPRSNKVEISWGKDRTATSRL